MQTTEDLRKLDQAKLNEELKKAKESAFKVRFQVRNGNSANTAEVAKKVKYVAQILTIMREKQHAPKNDLEKSNENL